MYKNGQFICSWGAEPFAYCTYHLYSMAYNKQNVIANYNLNILESLIKFHIHICNVNNLNILQSTVVLKYIII